MSTGDAPPPTRRGSVGRFLLRGSFWALMARIVAVLSGLAVQYFLARLLAPEDLGAYFLIQSVATVAGMLGQLGLNRTVVRFAAQAVGAGELGRARSALARAGSLALLSAAVVGGVYALWLGDWLSHAVFGSAAMAAGVTATGVLFAAFAFQSLTAGALRGLHRVGTGALLDGPLASFFTACALGALFVAAGRAEFLTVLWIAVAASATSALFGVALTGRLLAGVRSEPVAYSLLLRSALPLTVTGVAHAALQQGDLWIVGGLLEAPDVALYGAAKRLMRVINLPLVIINFVLPPLMADLHARGERERLERAVRGSATLAGLPGLAVIAVFTVASAEILGLVYGDFYRSASLLLTLFALERLVFVWVGPCATLLIMTGHERIVMRVTLLAGALTLCATLAGALLFGLTGVAAGFLLGSAVRQIWTWSETRRAAQIRSDVNLLDLRSPLEALRRALGR